MVEDAKIHFDHVRATFDLKGTEVVALGDFNLSIETNEFITLVGPSGCGKTTALNIAAGLLQPTSGAVRVDGEEVHDPGPERGVIFQQYALFPWLTVRKNIEFGLVLQRVPKKTRREVSERMIELTGLTGFADALPKNLSGGMKQRCAIARAYAVNPSILLMDEPFGALDALTRVRMQEQLLETWDNDKRTVMFITHDVDEAVYLANRVVVMATHPGRIQKIVNIDLPYPRAGDIRLAPRFTELRNEVWDSVFHQMQPTN